MLLLMVQMKWMKNLIVLKVVEDVKHKKNLLHFVQRSLSLLRMKGKNMKIVFLNQLILFSLENGRKI